MTPEESLAKMIDNLEEKTGRSLEQWLELTAASRLEKHGEIVGWLKSQHGVTHGYANVIAMKTLESRGGGPAGEADLLAAQYAGAKSALKPIYDALAAAVTRLGPDVQLAPKKANVSVRRHRQFALLQPSTATRMDVGIQLKGVKPEGRLEASGSFSAMVTHRVRVGSVAEVDAELIGWLKQAYDTA